MSGIDNLMLAMWLSGQVLIVFVANIYTIANKAHPNDTKFAKMWTTKIVVWIGFCMQYIPLLVVNMDVTYHLGVTQENQGTHLIEKDLYRDIWFGIILTQSFFVWIICPIIIVYYESNEKHSFGQRVKKALKT